jgi:hypothetical protein
MFSRVSVATFRLATLTRSPAWPVKVPSDTVLKAVIGHACEARSLMVSVLESRASESSVQPTLWLRHPPEREKLTSRRFTISCRWLLEDIGALPAGLTAPNSRE